MLQWQELTSRSDDRLGKQDIAEVNLACAVGLPAGPTPDTISKCLRKLDSWTKTVLRFTQLSYEQFFLTSPETYNHSETFFRSATLVTALQRHCGLRYNPAKIPEDAEFDARDTFIHGAILGDGGTCASIPVVVAAVGRRLGYPIKIASTKAEKGEHRFARWDGPGGERLNLEATAEGLGTPDDDYYRSGRYAMTPEREAAGGFLKSLPPREELAEFLTDRAGRWRQLGKWHEAIEARLWASALVPANKFYDNTLKLDLNSWDRDLNARKPRGFPEFFIEYDACRRFPSGLPLEIERDALAKQAMEVALSDPNFVRKYWEPMRRGELLPQYLFRVVVRFEGKRCEISIEGW